MKSIIAITLITMLAGSSLAQSPAPTPLKKIDPILFGFCLIGSVKSIQDVEGYIHTKNIGYILQLTDDLKMVIVACTQMFNPQSLKDYPPQCIADLKPITDAAGELNTAIQNKDIDGVIQGFKDFKVAIADASQHLDQFMKDCNI